jgi:flavin reductase (DIM6/NTAB) family NADH-FMN oxidoreductase RutF
MKKSLGAKTLAIPTPVWVIGSYDKNDKPNAMTVAWGGICCSKPPSVTISLRKATYTYDCLMQRKAYTVNIPSQKQIAEADYCGIASGRKTDKFADTGLTAVKSEHVDAPLIEEFPLVLECKVNHTLEVGLHTLFIAEIMNVRVDDNIVSNNGLPELSKLQPILYSPADHGYYTSGAQIGEAYEIGKKFQK